MNGKDTHPLYKHLRMNSSLYNAEKNTATEIKWNFSKFIVDAEGKVVSYHGPDVNPLKL